MSFRGSIDDERGGLLSELTAGFEALMQKADQLVDANARLSERLRTLQTEYRQQDTPNQTSSTSSTADVNQELSPALPDWRQNPVVDKGIQAWKLLKIGTASAVPLRNGKRLHVNVERLEASAGAQTASIQQPSTLERDFTTEGPKGGLKCPFSKRGSATCGGKPKQLDLKAFSSRAGTEHLAKSPDPIAREIHGEVENRLPEPEEGASKCPIRFMDQHAPEEVAKYVEQHKHEIPRSHEVCIKRYQANEASIRSLDAKYGSLVKMVQGLGAKHKPMFPADGEADEMEGAVVDERSIEKVQKWAKNLAEEQPGAAAPDTQSHSEGGERTGHFERPLEEVRLGESPSRPWGIRVPDLAQPAHSTEVFNVEKPSRPSSVAPPANAPVHESELPKPAAKCPFNHGVPNFARPNASKASSPHSTGSVQPINTFLAEAAAAKRNNADHSRVVFAGPVFFGYSAAEVAALMEALPGMANRPSDT